MKFETKREQLYGGALQHGKRFHYVVYLAGEKIAAAENKEEAVAKAANALLGAFAQQTSSIYSSVTADGSILTSREYAPGEAEYAFHRKEDGSQSGSCMGLMQINEKCVSLREYHAYVLSRYNEAVTPKAA
jgi:hypothetical protein